MYDEQLKAVRQDIDRIDAKLLPLLVERMKCSERVAKIKSAAGIPVLNTLREAEILDRVKSEAGEDFGDDAAELYGRIMSVSRRRQRSMMTNAQELFTKTAPAKISTIYCPDICTGESFIRKTAIDAELCVAGDESSLMEKFAEGEAVLFSVSGGFAHMCGTAEKKGGFIRGSVMDSKGVICFVMTKASGMVNGCEKLIFSVSADDSTQAADIFSSAALRRIKILEAAITAQGRFYMELSFGSEERENTAKFLSEIKNEHPEIKIIGCYGEY